MIDLKAECRRARVLCVWKQRVPGTSCSAEGWSYVWVRLALKSQVNGGEWMCRNQVCYKYNQGSLVILFGNLLYMLVGYSNTCRMSGMWEYTLVVTLELVPMRYGTRLQIRVWIYEFTVRPINIISMLLLLLLQLIDIEDVATFRWIE